MPGDRRPTDRELGGDLAGCQLSDPQVLEDLAAGRIGQRTKHTGLVICHVYYLAIYLDRLQPGGFRQVGH